MNYRMIISLLNKVLAINTAILFLPVIVSVIYNESPAPFFWAVLFSAVLFVITAFIKPKSKNLFAKEGFVVVALAWIVLSLIGCIPYLAEGVTNEFTLAFLDSVSAFTTTGASGFTDIEIMSHGLLFWRALMHWLGGMGILVFMLAVIPMSNEYSMYIMRAEQTGPVVGKLVPRARKTAEILYIFYIVLTFIEIIALRLCGMPFFDSTVNALSTAGTGGFSLHNSSIAYYNSASIDIVITVFMILFAVNFNLYYFIIAKRAKTAFKNHELRIYLGIIVVASVIIGLSIIPIYGNVAYSFRTSFFQVAAFISTTGFNTADFQTWPQIAKLILLCLMFIGGCAGGTGGGFKVSRIIILFKTAICEIKKLLHPHTVTSVRIEGQKLPAKSVSSVLVYFMIFWIITMMAIFLVAVDGHDFATTSSAVLTSISNVGPGFGMVGGGGSLSVFSPFSRMVLAACMLFGRLEIFPMLMLFVPSTWKKN